MECSGHGNLQAHLADNALALCALHRVTPRIETGDTAPGREALGALDAILSLHRFTADLAVVGARTRGRRPSGCAARFSRHDRVTGIRILVRSPGRKPPGPWPPAGNQRTAMFKTIVAHVDELPLGGVTRTLSERATLPVLPAH